MPSASYVKFEKFVENLAKGVVNLETDAIKIYLSNATPNVASHTVKADIAEISTGNGYSGPIDVNASTSRSGGTESIAVDDQTITASGGSIGPFRYVILYDDTPTSPADPLIAYFDYGSSISLADGESLAIDFPATLFTIA
jgi:hypothetical protein